MPFGSCAGPEEAMPALIGGCCCCGCGCAAGIAPGMPGIDGSASAPAAPFDAGPAAAPGDGGGWPGAPKLGAPGGSCMGGMAADSEGGNGPAPGGSCAGDIGPPAMGGPAIPGGIAAPGGGAIVAA